MSAKARVDSIGGGMDTARVSAAAEDRAHREQREADARRYLLRRGLDDIAEILGLVEPASPAPRRNARGKLVAR